MFGLMRGAPRLPYCGTCKTIGAIYGHPTRALLNHDTVFLGELLQYISPDQQWSGSYRSFNCLTLPKKAEIPVTLQFAAAATVVLAHFRITDHCADSKSRMWQGMKSLLSPTYWRALGCLRKWAFPVDELIQILGVQSRLEEEARSLAQVAEPTATATALFFSHGARLAQRKDLSEKMYRLGHRFGFLVYTLDAYEDRMADGRSGAFNPLLRFAETDGKEEILRAMRELEIELPEVFAIRLRRNVEERVGLRPRIFRNKCRAGIRERWQTAVNLARSIRERESNGVAKGVLIFASVSLVAFLVPHYARTVESWRQCMGLSMNLMVLGSVFASSPAVPESPPHAGETRKDSQSKGSSWCGGCDCDSCDCPCDGCSDCDCS